MLWCNSGIKYPGCLWYLEAVKSDYVIPVWESRKALLPPNFVKKWKIDWQCLEILYRYRRDLLTIFFTLLYDYAI